MAGGLLRHLTEKAEDESILKRKRESGILFSSGLIAGSALVGVGMALAASYSRTFATTLEIGYLWMGSFSNLTSLFIFSGLDLLVWKYSNKK